MIWITLTLACLVIATFAMAIREMLFQRELAKLAGRLDKIREKVDDALAEMDDEK